MNKKTDIVLTFEDKVHEAIDSYQAIILGNRKTIPGIYFDGSPEVNSKVALEVFRFAFEKRKGWDAQQIYEHASQELFKEMHLWNLWQKYIVLPEGLNNKYSGQRYIVYLLYPNKYKRDLRIDTLIDYQKLLNARRRGNKVKILKNFFDGSDGMVKAAICLQFIISEHMQTTSVEALYERFAASDIRLELDKWSLWAPCSRFWRTPVDFLHYALPENQQDEIAYAYAKKKYLQNRVRSASTFSPVVKEWKQKLGMNTPRMIKTFFDPLRNVKMEEYAEVMSFFVKNVLPTEPVAAKYLTDGIDGLCDLFLSEDIEPLLDKYLLLKPTRAVSQNYIEALEIALPPEERDIVSFEYAKAQFEKTARKEYKFLPRAVRAYSCITTTTFKEKSWQTTIRELSDDDYKLCVRYFAKKVRKGGKIEGKNRTNFLTALKQTDDAYENYLKRNHLDRDIPLPAEEFVELMFAEKKTA